MIDFLLFLQGFSNEFLDNLFLFVSSLTSELVYIAVICAIYWCVNKNKGIISAVTLVFSFSANTALKYTFAVPRPYTYSPVRQIDTETGYGYSFPSAHAQLSATFAGLGMINIRTKIMYAVGILLVVLTGFSRMYLGVHTPADIAVGYVLGVAVIFVSGMLFNHEKYKNIAAIILFAVNIPLVVLAGDRDLTVVNVLFAGCIIGLLLEERFVHFDVSGGMKEKIIRYAAGIAVLVTTKSVFGFFGKGISYFFTGFTITFIVPLLSNRLKKRLKKVECR